jgi:hypothetical protein
VVDGVTPPAMPPGQRWALRAIGLLMLFLSAVGTDGILRSANHEPWQRFGVLVAFTIACPLYVRLVWVRTRPPKAGPPEGTKRGLSEVAVEWGPVVLAAALALALWLSVLTA